MMADDFDACLDFTLREEGGFCDNPDDPGGATCHGITLATLRHWADDPGLGVDAVRNIPIGTCRAIYRTDYWNRMRCDAMPAGIDLMLFDHGVNAGSARSARILQQARGFSATECDGSVGPVTIGAADKADPKTLIDRMADLQTAYYRRLPTFAEFGTGWLARADRRHQAALAMLGHPAAPGPAPVA